MFVYICPKSFVLFITVDQKNVNFRIAFLTELKRTNLAYPDSARRRPPSSESESKRNVMNKCPGYPFGPVQI